MVAVGLLREQDGEYWIDFNLLRVDDQQRIIEVSTEAGRDLARALLRRADELRGVAGNHLQPGNLTAEFLYFALGCFSLDWDGLSLTAERGWRLGAQRVIDGLAFTPWAKERGAEVSLQGLYWGSHSSSAGDVTLTTFGDHHSLPRFGLPDLLWSNKTSFPRFEGLEDEKAAAARLLSAYERDVMTDVAGVMMVLGSDAMDAETLGELTGIATTKLERLLAFLEVADYVELRDGRWHATALVLRREDAAAVDAVAAIGRETMIEWHEDNLGRLRQDLADLTPIRNGVPFERVYTEIWHFAFGIANRTLVEEGLFADPYAADRRFKGFLPVVWESSLAEAP